MEGTDALPTEQFLSVTAQQGIAFFIMAVAILGLCWYLKVLDKRADDRATADAAAKKAADEREDARIAAAATREDARQRAQDDRYAALISQIMEQQKNMMNLLFGVVNRNSTVQEKIVESLNMNNAPSTTSNVPPAAGQE